MEPTATYLYCIVRAAGALRLTRAPRGLPGAARPSVVAVDRSLWIVVADVPLDVYGPKPLEASLGDMQWVADVAVAHEAVIEHVARQADATVIPMKLFTMFSTRDRAVAQTRSRRRDLDPVFRRIAGCEEWGVRMTRAVSSASRRDAPRSSSVAAPMRAVSGAAFLAAKKQARDQARASVRAAAAAADTVFDALSAVARDARRRSDAPDAATAPPVLDAAFLVPVAERARFRSAARRLAAGSTKAGAGMILTGPWPAYNFVQDESRR